MSTPPPQITELAAKSDSPAKSPAKSPKSTASDDRIEPAGEGEEAEADEFEPEELDAASIATSSESVTSSIFQHRYENGRRYHQYRHGRYPFPNDDTEQSREDMKQALHMELTDGNLFFAPIGDNPQKIIDLGTGTGLWAIEVADRYPSAEVLGTDLSPIQSTWVPPNVRFLIDDIEDEWLNGSDFDFVHLRSVVPILKDVPKLLERCLSGLKPGGWIEIQDYAPEILSDDDTTRDSYLVKLILKADEGLKTFGLINYLIIKDLQEHLEKAGFVNIQHRVIKAPIGVWPKDKRLRLCGMYMRHNVYDIITMMAAKPLTALMSPAEAEVFAVQARKNVNDPGHHAYFNYHFWMAQKPE